MSEIEAISVAVISVVVFFYALAFFLSFRKSSKYVSRVVRGESMNEEIAEYLVTTDLEYFQQDEKKRNPNKPRKFYKTFKAYRAMRATQEKKTNTVSNIVFAIFYVIVLIFLAIGIYIRVAGDEIFIGDYSYIVIESGSMSSANSNNTYLFESDGKTVKTDDGLGHDYSKHIRTFDMIQLKKINSESEVQLYDVVAYRDDDGDIICHRIISIFDYTDPDTGDVVKHYVFRGDANSISSDYERYGHDGSGRGLTYADFVGEFTGWTNYGLGLAVDYLKSDIGVICLASGVIVVAFYYYFDEKNNREILARENQIADRIDESDTYRFRWYLVYYRTNKKYKILTKDIFIEHDDFY